MNDKLIYAGGGLAVVVSIAAAVILRPLPAPPAAPQAAPEPAAVSSGAEAPEDTPDRPAEAQADATTEAAPEDAVTALPEPPAPAAPEAEAEDVAELAAQPPRLTDLRVEPDGLAVLSGFAEAGRPVGIMLDGVALDMVMADETGRFLALPDMGVSDRPRMLTLVLDPDGDALPGEETYLIAANTPPPEAMAGDAVAEDPAQPLEAEATPETQTATGTQTPAEAGLGAPDETTPESLVADVQSAEPPTETESADASSADTTETAPDGLVAGDPALQPEADTQMSAGTELADAPPVDPAETASEAIAAEDPAPPPETDTRTAEAQPTPDETSPDPLASEAPSALQTAGTELADAPTIPATEALPDPSPTADPTPPEDAPAATAPAILALDAEGGVRVVQPATTADTPPEVMSSVALDTITYNPAGSVVLAGRAALDGFVRLYVDNRPLGTLPVDEQGNWRTDLPQVDTGVYTLRIDEIDAGGEVVSRIETPFQREDPDTVAAAMADETSDPEFTIATRTVQPGNTLWAIARDRYGEGILYVQVFEANRDSIRNPDLIYPGQVFVLPELDD